VSHSLEKLRADYVAWHPAQVATDDIDPVYPWLRRLADEWDLDAEQRAWLVFCHVVWYHSGSTLVGFETASDVELLPDSVEGLWSSGLLGLPTETERRSHRPKPPLIKHLLSLRSTFLEAGGAWKWSNAAMGESEDPKERWLVLNDSLTKIVGNGRWAAYKTAEMLWKVCDLPVEAANAGHTYSSGPRKCLEMLHPDLPSGNQPEVIEHLDFLTEMWADQIGETDIARVETTLCDFRSMAHGRYYTGHDIDSHQHALLALGDRIPHEAWEARQDVFAPELLGELGGWSGVRKDLNVLYRDEGTIYRVN